MPKAMKMGRVISFWLATAVVIASWETSEARDCTEAQYKIDYPKIELAFGIGILRNDKGGDVFISEGYWTSLTFAQKVDFAESLSCAVAGVGKAIATITFRSDMTGKTIGEWHWGDLTVP